MSKIKFFCKLRSYEADVLSYNFEVLLPKWWFCKDGACVRLLFIPLSSISRRENKRFSDGRSNTLKLVAVFAPAQVVRFVCLCAASFNKIVIGVVLSKRREVVKVSCHRKKPGDNHPTYKAVYRKKILLDGEDDPIGNPAVDLY